MKQASSVDGWAELSAGRMDSCQVNASYLSPLLALCNLKRINFMLIPQCYALFRRVRLLVSSLIHVTKLFSRWPLLTCRCAVMVHLPHESPYWDSLKTSKMRCRSCQCCSVCFLHVTVSDCRCISICKCRDYTLHSRQQLSWHLRLIAFNVWPF